MDSPTTLLPEPPSPRRPNPLLTFLIHHNPFYLLSALCMIAGCYALNSALQTRSGELPKLLLLMGTLQLYELLLVALGLYLIVKHRIDRDGRTLLLLDAVFLVDLTFLNAETAATSLKVGLLINGLALLLAVAKIALVMSVLSVRFPTRAFGFVALQLVVLLGVPCALKWVEQPGPVNPGISPVHLYAAWWAAGLVLILFEAQRKLIPSSGHEPLGPGVRRDVMRIYAIVPFVSLVAHLGMLHYVYDIRFQLAYAAPVLLGLAAVAAGIRPDGAWRAERAIMSFMLPLLAFVASMHYPQALTFDAPMTDRFDLTPVAITAAGSYIAYVYAFLLPWAIWFLAAGAAGVATYAFGPTLSQTIHALDVSWDWTITQFRRLIPKTPVQWGITAVAASFAFLGIGAFVSLRKREPTEPLRAPGAAP